MASEKDTPGAVTVPGSNTSAQYVPGSTSTEICAVVAAVAFSELVSSQIELDELGMPIATPTVDDGVTLVNVRLMVPPWETGKV